jgi:hypothetical protein
LLLVIIAALKSSAIGLEGITIDYKQSSNIGLLREFRFFAHRIEGM